MAERNPPVWMQSGTYNAVDDRAVTGMLSDRTLSLAGNFLGLAGGVVPGFDQLNATANNTMQVTISGGMVVVPAPGATPPGAYLCVNEGNKIFTIDIEASGNPRLDVIYAEVEDVSTGGLQSEWRFGVKKGQPSANPVSPALTAGQFPLWQVRVIPAAQNGGTNKIAKTQLADLRRFNTAQGGVHITRSGVPNPQHSPGRLLYNVDTDYLYISDGATWQHYLSYKAWMDVFEALRPKHASISAPVDMGPNHDKDWDPTPPKKGSTPGSVSAVTVTHRSPSGMFKVSISSFGRTADTAGSGHVSVQVRQGNTEKFSPATGWRAIGFYSKNWEHHGTSFLVTGMPKDTNLQFRLMFRRTGKNNNTVEFRTSYLLVEPVL